MAGHSKFKNIQHRKGAQDKRRSKIFTKLVKEIITAAKIGGVEQNNNPRLRGALITARAQNLPKDRIDKALSQALNPMQGDQYEEIRYEGYGNGGIAVIVEALTDNRNRTASEVRSAFSKFGGNMGESGSVSFMFDRFGIIILELKNVGFDEIFELAAEYGALDVEDISDEDDGYNSYKIYTTVEAFIEIQNKFIAKFENIAESYFGWKAQNLMEIDELKAEKLQKLIDLLEDSDDVQYVFTNQA